jgi:hypothetical protein
MSYLLYNLTTAREDVFGGFRLYKKYLIGFSSAQVIIA